MQSLNDREAYSWNKIPELTLLFWIMKITATTLGETGGDLLAQTLNVGYLVSSFIFFGFFLVMLTCQLVSKRYIPPIYWAVIVATSTAGTTMSDYMDRTLELGYALGSVILVAILAGILIAWKLTEKTLSVTNVRSIRGEVFYWMAILVSNTLGTALGDFLADDSGLGFGGSALLISAVLALVVLAYFFTKLSRILLFWIAFILTRPFGATFGDLLTKSPEKGGMGYGTKGSSLILLGLLIVLVIYEMTKRRKNTVGNKNAQQRRSQLFVTK
ncbi:MAG: hypothetical protein ABIR30_04435 [Chitinophagaceae bacterium]